MEMDRNLAQTSLKGAALPLNMRDAAEVGMVPPARQIAEMIGRIYRRGLTTTSGGNISMRDAEGVIWVTPSGVDKGSLSARDIMAIRPDGTTSGQHKPSIEFPFHQAIYRVRPDIHAVVHAHSPALVAFSVVHQVPDTKIIRQAKAVCGDVGYARYAIPGSEDLGQSIAAEFALGANAVLMENHGVVVGGRNLEEAFERFETLEFCALTATKARILGAPRYLTEDEIARFDQVTSDCMPEMKTVNHPADETQLREDICAMVRRACAQGLMISSYGTLSARWRGDDFLITPRNVSRWDLQSSDLVQIRAGQQEPGKLPSRSVHMHQEIYKQHPDVNSIFVTQSPNIMAFSVTGQAIDGRSIPESWILLQDVAVVPFAAHFDWPNGTSKSLSLARPVTIVCNDSVIVVGSSLLSAFDRLEVAEASARASLHAARLGPMVPISDEQVGALRTKFLK